MIFREVVHAEQYMEPIDVRHGEYKAYDANARRLTLNVEVSRAKRWAGPPVEQTVIDLGEDPGDYTLEVRALLIRFLARASTEDLTKCSLNELVDALVSRYGFMR